MAISLVDVMAQSQNPMRRGLVQKITNESEFLKMLMFIPVDGHVYEYGEEVTLGTIAFRSLNEDYNDDVGVVNPKVEQLAIMGGTVKTDRQIMNKSAGAATRANRIASKVKKTGLFYDKYCIDGDPATNPKQFYGLNSRLVGNQVISMGANGAALTLAALDQAVDQTVGTSNPQKRIVCNKFTRRKINALKVAAAGGALVGDVGKQNMTYNDVPLIVLDEDGDEAAILGFDETQGASAICTSLYVIRLGTDTDGEYVQGLVGSNMIEHEDQGKRGSQNLDLVEANLGLAMFHGRAATRIKGILQQ